jgi:hypothetical protein
MWRNPDQCVIFSAFYSNLLDFLNSLRQKNESREFLAEEVFFLTIFIKKILRNLLTDYDYHRIFSLGAVKNVDVI